MIKAVIFDMDGVIIDSGPVHLRAWEKTLSTFNVKVWKHFFETRSGSSTKDFAQYYVDKYKLKVTTNEISELKK